MAIPVDRFDFDLIPRMMMASINAYVREGRPVGAFLRAVLSNDLKLAVQWADNVNINLLPVYVTFLVERAPADCWGSEALVNNWIASFASQNDPRRV